ncbi:MAG: glycosyltransferase [Cyclobacteriaceae bacterium]|nr:glycosyltransferase [Cyclobacteriaceae bacterium]
MKILHLLSSLQKINYGVWNAVRSTFAPLKDLGVENYLVVPEQPGEMPEELSNENVFFIPNDQTDIPNYLINKNLAVKNETVIISHGSWQIPTRLAKKLNELGFPWLAYPHGMLEPWSMQHKRWKKLLYFTVFEKRYLSQANQVIAVGAPEQSNLKKWFPNAGLIPNGIEPFVKPVVKEDEVISVLFLGRLHTKKNPLELAKAWIASSLKNKKNYQLIIAGPDEGEQTKIEKEIVATHTGNILLPGPVYGIEKEKLLCSSHFFALPSQSEGFPTSVLEAMTFQCVPIISEGCNFPEALQNNVALEVEDNIGSIKNKLEEISSWKAEEIEQKGKKAKKFVDENYSLQKIAQMQFTLYKQLLNA